MQRDEQHGAAKEIARRYGDRVEQRFARTPWRRVRFWLSFLAIAGGAAFVFLGQGIVPPRFFSTGPLSRQHHSLETKCTACHQPEQLGGGRFVEVLVQRFREGAPAFERIDQSCQACHKQHNFHAANVVENRSCSACHVEHRGPGPMPAVTNADCASCHNNAPVMQASAELGQRLPPSHFRPNPKVANAATTHQNILNLPRPPQGYTATFASFWEGHPEFQLHRQNVREADVLRFNHQLHLTGGSMPLTPDGTKLDCNYCHKPEPNGRYMQRISFEANCQACHSLQFDVKNPDFHLPHGDAQLVRTFLRTLPAQYAELARRQRGITDDRQVNEFAVQQIRGLLTQFGSPEALERAVFFTQHPYRFAERADAGTRARFAGCAYCHEVKQASGGTFPMPEVVPPLLIDRWLPHGHFSHLKHATVECRTCHAAHASRDTSDVLIPTKESCTTCHQPQGMAARASDCATCHAYHAPDPRLMPAAAAGAGSFKQLLLGRAAGAND